MSGKNTGGRFSLASGERVIWQGKPSMRGFALRAFHVRAVAIYFALAMAARVVVQATSASSLADALQGSLWIVPPAACGIAMLTVLGILFARAATYTLTDRRMILQFGVALPITMTIPLQKIADAALKVYRDGSGDIPLRLTEDRGSFVLLWPHVRPWKLRGAEPMLRSVPDAANVALILSEALQTCGTAALPASGAHGRVSFDAQMPVASVAA